MSDHRGNRKLESSTASSSMTVELKPSFDYYVVCPYDKAHQIMPTRLATHLIKCSRNHPGKNMVRCPLNTTHVLQASDLQSHVYTCESRSTLERYTNPDTLPLVEPRASVTPLVTCSENWDDEPPVETYNPIAYCEGNLIIRNLNGASASERRAFREKQRKKFRDQSN